MKKLLLILRLLQINFILARYSLDKIIFSFSLFNTLRFVTWLNPWNWRKSTYSRGKRIRLALEALGPDRKSVV